MVKILIDLVDCLFGYLVNRFTDLPIKPKNICQEY